MTDKQQIIEEMVDVMAISCGECYSCPFSGKTNNRVSCTDYLTAEALYNAGYRRVPKNAIVLTNEKLELGEWKGEVQVMNMARQTYDACLKQTRKGTAKEIFEQLRKMQMNFTYDVRGMDTLTISKIYIGDIYELAKQYGVEVLND